MYLQQEGLAGSQQCNTVSVNWGLDYRKSPSEHDNTPPTRCPRICMQEQHVTERKEHSVIVQLDIFI